MVMVHEGAESVAGFPCEIISFPLGNSPIKYRFWVDLSRGGHPLKFATLNGDRVMTRTSQIILEKVDKPGVTAWLPVSGLCEAFIETDENQQQHFLSDSMNTEALAMLKGTLRINATIIDSRFTIKYGKHTMISDRLNKLEYEFGQDRRPPPTTRAEAEQRLKEQLRDAEEQGQALLAASWLRGGHDYWYEYLPFAIGGLAAIGLVGMIAKKIYTKLS